MNKDHDVDLCGANLPDEDVEQDNERQQGAGHSAGSGPSSERTSSLEINLSRSLYRKLMHKAAAEGVPMQDLASELLAEGLVLRAWEIMERKSAMRQSSAPSSGGQNARPQNKPPYRNGNNSSQNFSRGRPSPKSNGYHSPSYPNPTNPSQNNSNRRPANYHHILEDSASFLEYVRSQEKKNT